MKTQMITIPKQEYEELKIKANIDIEFLRQLTESLKDIKLKNIRRVK